MRGPEPGDPPAVTVVNEAGRSPYVLLCEHASRYIPPRYGKLGLPDHELTRHIAWDIGAEGIARALSKALDAPLFLSGYSRLLIDCNRPIGAPTSIPEISETTAIPGNSGLDAAERQYRAEQFYWPFQKAIFAHLDERQRSKRPTIVFGVHTFTPVFKGFVRPWHAGVLYRKSEVFGEALLKHLAEPGLVLAANEPYVIEDDHDHTVPVHGEARGLDAVLIEVRQDLVAEHAGQAAWAARLARALSAIAA
ncbi:MAG: N-formylglutamate amidohydrolase [Hyphomicrobiaceae bacterium]